MKNVKLSVKIIGGFGIVLVLMLLVIGIYFVSSSKTSSGYSGLLAGDVATNKYAAAIESAMLQARRNEKDFILRQDLKYLSEHAENVDMLIENAEAIKQIKTREGDQKTISEISRVVSLANEYKDNFTTLVEAQKRAGLDEKSGAQGAFRDAAHKIAASLPGYDVDDVIIALLQMRRYEKDYVRSEQEKDQKKFVAAMDAYESVLKQSSCEADSKKSQEKSFKKYKRWAQEYFDAEDSVYRMDINDSLQELANAIESSLSSVRVPGAMALLLDIRKNEKDFIIRRNSKYLEKTHKAIAKLHDAFANSGILQKHIDDGVAGIAEYQTAFDIMVKEYAVMEKATEVMRDTVHQIEPILETIIAESNQQAETSTHEISSMAKNMSRTAIIVGAITFLIGSFLSFIISRSITLPINEIVRWMISGAEQVSSASNQVSSSSQALADGSSEQAAAIEQTSASMEELSSMTKKNAENASHADSLMREASKIIQGTDASMDEMGQSMEKIASASEDTSKIIKTIDEIAFQTNLLALNAAVEAARAGEAGAGFAVVADEVRNLAMRATEAAKDTTVLIESTIQQVKSGREIVEKTTASFKEVSENSAKVGSLVGEIAAASQEQSQGLTQINQAITQMDNVTQQNSASAEESAAASKELNSQAEAMMDIVRNLKGLVDGDRSLHLTQGSGAGSSKGSRHAALPEPKRLLSSPRQKTTAKPVEVIQMDDDEDDFEDF